MSDVKRAHRRREKRRSEKSERKKAGLQILALWGIQPKWHCPTHCSIFAFGRRWDYWPTTGKWMRLIKGAPQIARSGVEMLIVDIEAARSQEPAS